MNTGAFPNSVLDPHALQNADPPSKLQFGMDPVPDPRGKNLKIKL